MTKKEKELILHQYELILNINNAGIDKSDSMQEFIALINNLGMEYDRYVIENKVIAKNNNYSIIVLDEFEMLFESLAKHNYLVNYDIDEIENALDTLKWDMSDEEYTYNLKRVSIIKEYIANAY